MNGYEPSPARFLQSFGCLAAALAFFFLCLMPFLLVDAMNVAMRRLHLSSEMALLVVLGILIGSIVNLPVYRLQRSEEQYTNQGVIGPWGFAPRLVLQRPETVIAVNLGGCIIPSLLAVWEVRHLVAIGGPPLMALAGAAGLNVIACYLVARPVRGVGIMMPGLVSPLVSVLATWLMLGGDQWVDPRAPVAFVAGVLGPLVGADLLHLKDITRVSVGMLSIGGAGTFDGIVLSGIVAVLLV